MPKAAMPINCGDSRENSRKGRDGAGGAAKGTLKLLELGAKLINILAGSGSQIGGRRPSGSRSSRGSSIKVRRQAVLVVTSSFEMIIAATKNDHHGLVPETVAGLPERKIHEKAAGEKEGQQRIDEAATRREMQVAASRRGKLRRAAITEQGSPQRIESGRAANKGGRSRRAGGSSNSGEIDRAERERPHGDQERQVAASSEQGEAGRCGQRSASRGKQQRRERDRTSSRRGRSLRAAINEQGETAADRKSPRGKRRGEKGGPT
ncbi:hypothetical protein KSP39_PZI017464 [Platanthera zijinensis]|uniref:Uncharacterized protein n=1 Tax=Platanthera zijinensis TaxID=2320716 RepID=A0AAP0FZD7_9ASPA